MVEEETLRPLRVALEKARERLDYVLVRLREIEEPRSLRWRCFRCGYLKHFTKPMPADVAPPCPKCRGTSFEIA